MEPVHGTAHGDPGTGRRWKAAGAGHVIRRALGARVDGTSPGWAARRRRRRATGFIREFCLASRDPHATQEHRRWHQRRDHHDSRHHRAQTRRGSAARVAEAHVHGAGVTRCRCVGSRPRDARGRLDGERVCRCSPRRQTPSARSPTSSSGCIPTIARRPRRRIDRAIATKSGFDLESRVVLPDGGIRWMRSAGRVIADPPGSHERLIGVTVDVTGRHLLEAQFLQAQKMEAVGQLAGGVAHDFNNLLTAILGYAALVKEGMNDPSRRRNVDEVVKAATRATALTRQLLAFSRQEVPEVTVLNANEIVTDLLDMLRRLIGEHMTLTTNLADELDSIRTDRGQLEQVIVNLVVNARDAMPKGGGIRDRDGERARRCGCERPWRSDRRRRLRDALGHRCRRGHERGRSETALQAVLHDEGSRQGNRARACDGSRDRDRRARSHRGGKRAGKRIDLPCLSAPSRRSRS